MKTSNYILISFFVFLFGGVFLLYISAKYIPHLYIDQEYSALEKPLDPFSVLIAKPGATVRLRPGETLKMSLFYTKSDSCTLPPFTVRNDTLFVSAYPDNLKQREVNVYCNSLKSIQEEERAKISIEKQFDADTLLVKLESAEFSYFSEQDSPKRITLTLIANRSKVNIGETNFDHLDIQLNESKMNVWNNSINNLTGSITNNSNLNIVEFKKINLEVDETSKYQLSKNN